LLAEADELSELVPDVAAFAGAGEAGASLEGVAAPSRADDPSTPADPADPPSLPVVEPSPTDFEGPRLALELARRSFLAQPEPLKWIAGVANAFLIGPPPHRTQVTGDSVWTPRRTSNRLPQFAQS
jgi:hypothetical protein